MMKQIREPVDVKKLGFKYRGPGRGYIGVAIEEK